MHWGAKVAASLVAGIALGLGATWMSVVRTMPGAVVDGPWQTNLLIGSAQSDLYTRAAVALNGIFALNRNEAIYYVATRDSDGAALQGDCRYEVSGRDPEARWWSLTAYGSDEYLIANPTNRYSIDKSSVWRLTGGRFSISVGPRPEPVNWIAATGSSFSLVLRLFNPAWRVSASPAHAVLPRIRRIGCS
jgi:hypothetical protein